MNRWVGLTLTIEKVKIAGNQFTFIVTAPDGGYKVTLKVVSDSRIEGGLAFTPSDGAEVTAKLALEKTAPK
jgi:hypothetical protein